MVPEEKKLGLAKFCDVFCEQHVFTPDETRTICRRAKELGLGIKLHADELTSSGGAELAASLGATSADHLAAISDAGIAARIDAVGALATVPRGPGGTVLGEYIVDRYLDTVAERVGVRLAA